MAWAKDLLLVLVALEHLGFLYLEMFLWSKPIGQRIFRQSAEQAKQSQALAANQGLYNGFLAAGLIWAVLDSSDSQKLAIFFLSCVVIAACYGAYSVGHRILLIQGVPALLALLVWIFL